MKKYFCFCAPHPRHGCNTAPNTAPEAAPNDNRKRKQRTLLRTHAYACFVACVAVCLTLCLAACTVAPPEFDQETLLAQAAQQTTDLINADFDSVVNGFDKTLAKQLDATALQAAWESVTKDLGSYVGHVSTEYEIVQQYFVVTTVEEYQESGVKITCSYRQNGEMAGINLNYQTLTQPLVVNDVLEEVAVSIGDTLPLDGILTLPAGVSQPPVVLLVAGSGAMDKNETIFRNKPFEDIAHTLAAQGIASLRYDKRYYTYPQEATKLGAELTLQDEVLQDVDFALALLASDSRVNNQAIFVLGHSLGGGLTPYIAATNPCVTGIISMAGSLRPLYELSYDQNMAIAAQLQNGELGELSDDEIEALQKQLAQVEIDIMTLHSDLSLLPKDTPLLGLYAGYQQSVKEYAGERFIATVDLPILVLQGGADFQVIADTEYPLWQKALTGRDDATLVLFDNLNHLMMPSDGTQDISEYQTQSTVAPEVIEEIAAFVQEYANHT